MSTGPKLLDGNAPAGFLQIRHTQIVAGLSQKPRLAIVRSADNPAGDRYLVVKRAYGEAIGVPVDLYVEEAPTLLERIEALNADSAVTGIILQLPIAGRDLTQQALAAVAPSKDTDGLGPNSPFEATTAKAVLWLLAAHNIDLAGRSVIVGQGRLVGRPLAARLEAAGREVITADINTVDLGAVTRTADLLFTGTGQAGLIRSDMVKAGAVVVDTGAPSSELEPALYQRADLRAITPNPGGVGPMTVACLFDNLVIAAATPQAAV